MTGILDKFHIERDFHGARIVARSRELTSYCTDEREIDGAIQLLKDDLDACAKEMKRLMELDARGALFEGWPTGV